LKFSLKHVSLQVPPWRNSLRQAVFVSTAAATVWRPIKSITLVGAIDVISGGGWGRGACSRRWRYFSVGGLLLAHLLFFIRVTEDDDLVIARRPKDITVEVAKKPSGEILIS
jgi:hypothetical protein